MHAVAGIQEFVSYVVNALAGPQNPGQYAQAGTPVSSGGQEIGRVATVQGNAAPTNASSAVSPGRRMTG